MDGWKPKYTARLNFIGITGLLSGVIFIASNSLQVNKLSILGAFLLISAVFFLFVKREITYLMYTGMFTIFVEYFTLNNFYLGWIDFIMLSYGWLLVGYLIYKYLDFKKIISNKKTYKKQYDEPHKKSKSRTGSLSYYYRVLGASENSSLDEIKNKYRTLVKMYHPDVSADPDAEKKFREIQRAYEILSNPENRAQYDRFERFDPSRFF